MAEFFSKINFHFKDHDLFCIIKRIDKDQDGSICYSDFVEFILPIKPYTRLSLNSALNKSNIDINSPIKTKANASPNNHLFPTKFKCNSCNIMDNKISSQKPQINQLNNDTETHDSQQIINKSTFALNLPQKNLSGYEHQHSFNTNLTYTQSNRNSFRTPTKNPSLESNKNIYFSTKPIYYNKIQQNIETVKEFKNIEKKAEPQIQNSRSMKSYNQNLSDYRENNEIPFDNQKVFENPSSDYRKNIEKSLFDHRKNNEIPPSDYQQNNEKNSYDYPKNNEIPSSDYRKNNEIPPSNYRKNNEKNSYDYQRNIEIPPSDYRNSNNKEDNNSFPAKSILTEEIRIQMKDLFFLEKSIKLFLEELYADLDFDFYQIFRFFEMNTKQKIDAKCLEMKLKEFEIFISKFEIYCFIEKYDKDHKGFLK